MVTDTREQVKVYRLEAGSRELIPVIAVPDAAAGGLYLQKTVDLSRQLVRNPDTTFIADVTGCAMADACIANPARLLIDRSETVCNNDIVLARVGGAFVVRRYAREHGRIHLRPENREQPHTAYTLDEGMDFEIWGVVTQVLIDPRLVFFHDCTS